jgi:hypothetical protein
VNLKQALQNLGKKGGKEGIWAITEIKEIDYHNSSSSGGCEERERELAKKNGMVKK